MDINLRRKLVSIPGVLRNCMIHAIYLLIDVYILLYHPSTFGLGIEAPSHKKHISLSSMEHDIEYYLVIT